MRNSNVEALRFTLMAAICVWHMFVHGLEIAGCYGHGIAGSVNNYLAMTLLVPFVNCFMLISGYFGIRLTWHRIKSFVLQGLFYFLLAFGIYKVMGWHYVIFDNISLLLTHILPISSYNWWFLTDYVLVMLISPFINIGLEQLPRKQIRQILIALLFINCFGFFINIIGGSNFFSLLCLYLLGRTIRIENIKLSTTNSLSVWVFSTILLISVVYFFYNRGSDIWLWNLYSYNNPLIVIQALSILMLVMSFKPTHNHVVNFLGHHCFAIYLLTEMIGLKLYHHWAQYFIQGHYLILSGSIILVMIACVAIDWAREKIMAKCHLI